MQLHLKLHASVCTDWCEENWVVRDSLPWCAGEELTSLGHAIIDNQIMTREDKSVTRRVVALIHPFMQRLSSRSQSRRRVGTFYLFLSLDVILHVNSNFLLRQKRLSSLLCTSMKSSQRRDVCRLIFRATTHFVTIPLDHSLSLHL